MAGEIGGDSATAGGRAPGDPAAPPAAATAPPAPGSRRAAVRPVTFSRPLLRNELDPALWVIGLAACAGFAAGMKAMLAGFVLGALMCWTPRLWSPRRVTRFRPAKKAVLTWVEVAGMPITHRKAIAFFEDVTDLVVSEHADGLVVTAAIAGHGVRVLEAATGAARGDLSARARRLGEVTGHALPASYDGAPEEEEPDGGGTQGAAL